MTQPLLKKDHRYVVTYESEDTGRIMTFSAVANSASIATAKVIAYIEDKSLHEEGRYTLIPRISKDKTNYNID